MGKHRKQPEQKHEAPGHAAENPQVVPDAGAELEPELEPDFEQAMDDMKAGVTERLEIPELWGFGVARGAGGWLAFRVSSRGAIEVLNPLRKGEIAGEQRHTALARMQTAIKHAYAAPQKRGG